MTMKVTLLKALKGRGKAGDEVEVARGFAINYLFPRRIARPSDRELLRLQNGMRADTARVRIFPRDVKDVETTMVDFLADVQHMCERDGLDFDALLDRSRRHYEAERAGDDLALDGAVVAYENGELDHA